MAIQTRSVAAERELDALADAQREREAIASTYRGPEAIAEAPHEGSLEGALTEVVALVCELERRERTPDEEARLQVLRRSERDTRASIEIEFRQAIIKARTPRAESN